MAIKTLQKRLTQVGVIRLGRQLISKKGKPYPSKLETLRFTSPSRSLIDAVAGAYGGEVKEWAAPTGPQWEVITGAREIPVMVPPQRIDPNLEHWGNGYRDRHCDGETEAIRKAPCLCAAAQLARKPFAPRDVCKPTTRMSLMLAEIPSLGTWKLESHGWNAAAELPMLAEAIEKAPQPIPARLEVQTREKKVFDPNADEGKQIDPRVFMVPVLHFDWVTPAQAFGGEIGSAARAALGAATAERQQIAASAEQQRRRFTPQQYITMADDAQSVKQVRMLWDDARADEALTDAVKAILTAKAAEFETRPRPADAQPPADAVVDAEIVPDAQQVWAQIEEIAKERGWTPEVMEGHADRFLGESWDESDGIELTRFLDAVRNGEFA